MEGGLYIVIVDDDSMDRMLVRQAIKKAGIQITIEECEDGMELRDNAQSWEPNNLPSVIILDINMPKVNGFEVLEHFKKDRILSAIPIIIFSTSDAPLDIEKSLNLGAQCYLVKPTSFDKYDALINVVKEKIEQSIS